MCFLHFFNFVCNKNSLMLTYGDITLKMNYKCTDELLRSNAQHTLAEQNLVYSVGSLTVGSLWLTCKLQDFSYVSQHRLSCLWMHNPKEFQIPRCKNSTYVWSTIPARMGSKLSSYGTEHKQLCTMDRWKTTHHINKENDRLQWWTAYDDGT